ncbi:MAG: N-acetylmuramoyl-L-alanine amidase [Deltaproteobacteria bacterium]|nr:N-acetylmuramoyl-L-alanine amidase [Deltaproteobacteria bacterium]
MIQLLLLWLTPVVAADPQSPNTLVLPSGEEIELPYIRNWTAPEAKLSLRWPACQTTSHAMTGPTAIMLHEVGAPNNNFGDKENRCIHFYVRQDGVILQLAPLDRTWDHAPNAGHAIGIEIANGYGGANVS